jgi:dolichol-phosphate mannosyltransferase
MYDTPERPPIAGEPLSVILVVADDIGQLEKGLNSWTAFLDSLKRDYEILLITSSDSDNVAELAGRHARVRVLAPDGGSSFGAALRTGLAAAQHPLIFYSTADKRYRAADLQLLLNEIDRVDLVAGYRASRPVPGWLRVLGWGSRLWSRLLFGLPLERLPGWLGWRNHAFQWLVRLLTGVRIHDLHSEFKLFRREVFTRIPIQSDGPMVHTEVLAKANFMGCMMGEVPITYRPGQPGPPGPLGQLITEGKCLLRKPVFRRLEVATETHGSPNRNG